MLPYTGLQVFEHVVVVTGVLTVQHTMLHNLSAFGAVQSIGGGLSILNNALLVTDSLPSVQRIGGHTIIRSNPKLKALEFSPTVEEISGKLDIQYVHCTACSKSALS